MFAGLNCSIGVWSREIIETVSNAKPVWPIDPSAIFVTSFTNCPLFSCISSRVIFAATSPNASAKRP